MHFPTSCLQFGLHTPAQRTPRPQFNPAAFPFAVGGEILGQIGVPFVPEKVVRWQDDNRIALLVHSVADPGHGHQFFAAERYSCDIRR